MTPTTTTTRKGAAMLTVTPRDRFAAADLEWSLPLASRLRKAIREARYWESFRDSYTPEQVDVAVKLIVAIGADEGSLTIASLAADALKLAD